MLLSDVITASNLNPEYYIFIPIFIKAWKKHFPNINIHIILIATDIIPELNEYKEYITLFKPIPNIESSFISQNIRLFYPCLINATNGILITDIDMIPMNRIYYTESIESFSNDKFICYRPLSCVGKNEMVICYNIAHQRIWKDIFNIETEEDIIERIKSIYQKEKYYGENANKHYKPYWITDQLYLYEKTQEWNQSTSNLIILDESKHFNRLIPTSYKKNISYSDFHMPRPFNKIYYIFVNQNI